MNALSRSIKHALRRFGVDLVRYPAALPADVPADVAAICQLVAPYTMTSPQRILALCEAVAYVHAHRIEGDIVECGVWKGGSMMAAARVLAKLGATQRKLYLFDTFEGMSPPSEHDVAHDGESASSLLARSSKEDARSVWCQASMETVRKALDSTGYPGENVHLVAGMVEQTIPAAAPEKIALLRLDTDWYESTRHELEHLFPRLSIGGVLIIDDYGHWKGARKAVDEFLSEGNIKLLLNRIDFSGRIAVRTG